MTKKKNAWNKKKTVSLIALFFNPLFKKQTHSNKTKNPVHCESNHVIGVKCYISNLKCQGMS